ncbi:MAG: DUF393 domain-containing protein [Nitrososphaerota archaeon]|nr:DUF393 domain-containing protein [Nitrososphaerota archaeon]MDG7023194.1 DUF393 domain-containing protein [Nitrososphaerota archaeon]
MKYLLVYDDRCGPCTRFRNVVELLDARRRLDYAGLDEAERSGSLGPVPAPRRSRSFHLVSPDGRVWSGESAFPHLAALVSGGRVLSEAMKVPPVFAATSFVYSVFSRLHDSGYCSGLGCPAKAAMDG